MPDEHPLGEVSRHALYAWVSSTGIPLEESIANTRAWSMRSAEKAMGKNRAKHFGKVHPVTLIVHNSEAKPLAQDEIKQA